jgi:hypothetical protein
VADLSREARDLYFAQRNIDTPTREEVEALSAFDSTVKLLCHCNDSETCGQG